MSWWHRVPAALLVVVGALVACGDDDGDGAPTTTSSTSTTEAATTTTTVDPFTVPDDPADITEEYVEAVLTELEKINGDALRLAVAEGMSPDVTDLLEPIFFDGQLLADRANAILGVSQDDLPQAPGDIDVEVLDLVHASLDCVVADVAEDYSRIAPEGVPHVEVRIGLSRLDASPTGWGFALRDLSRTADPEESCD